MRRISRNRALILIGKYERICADMAKLVRAEGTPKQPALPFYAAESMAKTADSLRTTLGHLRDYVVTESRS